MILPRRRWILLALPFVALFGFYDRVALSGVHRYRDIAEPRIGISGGTGRLRSP